MMGCPEEEVFQLFKNLTCSPRRRGPKAVRQDDLSSLTDKEFEEVTAQV